MKKLSELFKGYPDILINDIKINSKEVVDNDLFVCIKGITKDRNNYIDEAIKNGAVAIVTNKKIKTSVPVIYVDNPNKELANLCSKFYDYPENKLDLIGITGTNGKTTVAEIIKDIIGNDCGYLGTNGIICSKFNEKIRNTTPDSDRLFKYFDMFLKANCKYVSMEASSEALLHNRLNNIMFNVGVITNITEDHLNVHKTIKSYVACKQKIIKHIKKDGVLILNTDDKYYQETRKLANSKILSFGKKEADLQIIDFTEYINKTEITIKYKEKLYNITSPLLGEFNVYNLCAAILVLISLGKDINEIISNIKRITIPSGRMEFINNKQDYYIIVDYAHTPDAFKNIYNFLNKVKKGKIITVTGSAGGREHEKRKEMGKIVLDNSDYCIFTMDDPRNEDVNSIIDELVSDTNKTNYERIIDRTSAINKALDMAKKENIILIAGKGDDNYMAIGNDYLPYSDKLVINDYFKD
jgi:UDP-N-acetylmuramoyl-L-alanyl-D-glutamate--2,6-diaminopimelate ligase